MCTQKRKSKREFHHGMGCLVISTVTISSHKGLLKYTFLLPLSTTNNNRRQDGSVTLTKHIELKNFHINDWQKHIWKFMEEYKIMTRGRLNFWEPSRNNGRMAFRLMLGSWSHSLQATRRDSLWEPFPLLAFPSIIFWHSKPLAMASSINGLFLLQLQPLHNNIHVRKRKKKRSFKSMTSCNCFSFPYFNKSQRPWQVASNSHIHLLL